MTNALHMLLVSNYEVYYIYYRFMSVLIFQLILSHLSQFIKYCQIYFLWLIQFWLKNNAFACEFTKIIKSNFFI